MHASRPMISASYYVALERFAASRGLNIRDHLSGLDIDVQAVGLLEANISCEAFVALVESLAQTAGDEAFSLHFIDTIPPRPAGVFQHIIFNSRTLRDAFLAIARFLVLVTDAFKIQYEEEAGIGWLVYDFNGCSQTRTQFVDGQIALIALRARQLRGDTCKPAQVDLERRPPVSKAAQHEFQRMFGVMPRFDQPVNRIGFTVSELSKPLPAANRELYNSAHGYAKQLLGLKDAERTFTASVAAFITSALPRGDASETRACTELGVSPRTMQRTLASEGTTFKTLMEETRMALARHYLTDTDLSLTAIAFLLGYSELSAFSRAAKAWHGDSPSTLRKRLRTSAPAGPAVR